MTNLREESLAMKFSRLPKYERDKIIESLTPDQQLDLDYDWSWWARPKQLLPMQDDWNTLLMMCGRGFGKTRTACEWIRYIAKTNAGCKIALVGATAQILNRTIVRGEGGILDVCPKGEVVYKRGDALLEFKNGTVAFLYSADEPDRLRGPNHHFALADDIVAWRYAETYDMLKFTLRLGKSPKILVTTTAKPTELILSLIGGERNVDEVNNKEVIRYGNTVIVRGETFENTALAPSALQDYINTYGGTLMGDQELSAKIILNVPDAIWKRAWIKHLKKFDTNGQVIPRNVEFVQTIVSIDPATTSTKKSDDTAIVVTSKGSDGLFYVRHAEGMKESPKVWAEKAVEAFYKYGADKIVAERNNGGLMVEETLRNVKYVMIDGRKYTVEGANLPIETIHAKNGKYLRATPVAMLYEQGRVIHDGTFGSLETQMIQFTGEPGGDDDLVDALVYGLTTLSGVVLMNYQAPKTGGKRTVSNLDSNLL